jgi:uncharacterized membrane protein (UPF0127 family)
MKYKDIFEDNMNKKSESLLTLETARNDNFSDATQKEPSSPSPGNMMSQFSPADSYENGKISDITETEQDPEVQVSLTKLNMVKNFLDETIRKINKISYDDNIITYNVNYSDNISKFSLKYASKQNVIDDSFIAIDFRNHMPHKKFSGFVINLDGFNLDDQKRIISNVLKFSRPVSNGIFLNINKKANNFVKSNGFEILESNNDTSSIYVRKNELNKVASIDIFDKYSFQKKAIFFCDKADTIEEKIAGLQVYPKLKYGSGLIFSYATPQDVMYHMGTVDFPIDIAFVGSNNEIKKIYQNIKPGDLATFGASGIKYVFEALGGSLKSLGVSVGDKLTVSSISNESFLKQASINEAITDKPIYYKINEHSSIKLSSDYYDIVNCKSSTELPRISKIASNNNKIKKVSIFDFDDVLFSTNSTIKLFKISDNKKSYTLEHDLPVYDFLQKASSINKLSLIPNKLGSFSNFLSNDNTTNPIARKMFIELSRSVSSDDLVIFATRTIGSNDLYKNLILKRAEEETILNSAAWSSKVMNISDDINSESIIRAASENFGGDSFKYISSATMNKKAGIPIPDNIKEEAKKALEGFKKSAEMIEVILDAIEKNNTELSKLKDNPKKIESYKGVYHQSCKRNAKKIFNMLSVIKESLKTMNSVKDISSVSEKVDSMTLSCSQYVDAAEAIFALVDKMNDGEKFLTELSELTLKFSKSTEDIENNTSNFINYISKNILNQKIISG